MHGALAGLFCGAQGDDPPGPLEPPALACGDLTQRAPAFFALLDDPAKPLDALRAAVADLAQVQCFDASRPACTDDAQCDGLTCDDGQCACRLPYNALGEVLRAALRGLAAASREPAESAAARCLSVTDAAQLAQPNHLCELKRAWSVLRSQDAVGAFLADPRLSRTLQEISDYSSGKLDGTVHDAIAGTLGRMARRDDLCDPADMATLAEKLLANLTPDLAAQISQTLLALVQDPTLRPFLLALASGGNAQGRQSVIYLAHYFITEISAVSSGAEASQKLQAILDQLVYPAIQNDALKAHIQAVADLLARAISDQLGAFPALQRVVSCAANPAIDTDPDTGKTGEIIGAVYDLLVDPQGVDLPTALGLFQQAVALDQDGQLVRALHGLVLATASDAQALDASRAAVAEALCGPAAVCDGASFVRGMLPALALLVQHGAVQDLLTLLSDVLDGCGK